MEQDRSDAPVPGGAGTTMVGSLDMADEKDRGLLRRAVAGHVTKNKRWHGVDDGLKERATRALGIAIEIAVASQDARNIAGCVKTLAVLEGQNQADEHLEEKYARLDSGQATETVQHVRRVVLQIEGTCQTSSPTTT